ncbi:MAG TPA: sigma-54-dependent Fis family transcriptional regulator [Planctomycetaceae bacterium]|nr:sigma-54-dependent Fis family transcriptional regulator [Planctomycetaceae bacterium]
MVALKTSTPPRVLVIDNTLSLAQTYQRHLIADGLMTDHAALGKDALQLLSERDYDVVLLDLQLPDIHGNNILHEINVSCSNTCVIVVTADDSARRATESMRLGAYDYLVKPISPTRLLVTVRNAIERFDLHHEIDEIRLEFKKDGFGGFIGSSRCMQSVYASIGNVATSKATVFVTGESGTGKEVCANTIHQVGQRADKPFIVLNCGAIPAELIESEIFGHVKGSFTGAIADHNGTAKQAHGGTLFLDEVCEMDVKLQTKLLRFLQTGTFQKIGSAKLEKVDIRIICATNKDPVAEIGAGRFREDLYYRLNVIPIELPALRERDDDVVLIAQAVLKKYAREEGRLFKGFTPQALDCLRRYRWPGNVRELQNVIRRVVVMNEGSYVDVDMLPSNIATPQRHGVPLETNELEKTLDVGPISTLSENGHREGGTWIPAGTSLAKVEKIVIEGVIDRNNGNITVAARQLGVNPSTLYRKRTTWEKENNNQE